MSIYLSALLLGARGDLPRLPLAAAGAGSTGTAAGPHPLAGPRSPNGPLGVGDAAAPTAAPAAGAAGWCGHVAAHAGPWGEGGEGQGQEGGEEWQEDHAPGHACVEERDNGGHQRGQGGQKLGAPAAPHVGHARTQGVAHTGVSQNDFITSGPPLFRKGLGV